MLRQIKRLRTQFRHVMRHLYGGDATAMVGAQQELGLALEAAGAAPESISGMVNAAVDNSAQLGCVMNAGTSFVDMISQQRADHAMGFPRGF